MLLEEEMTAETNLSTYDGANGSNADVTLNISKGTRVDATTVGLEINEKIAVNSGTSSSRKNDMRSSKFVVVVASFFSLFVVGVTNICFSVFYIYLVDHFQCSMAYAGWIGSLFFASGNILGMIFSVFVKIYGCRVVCVAGSISWFIGFAISAFAPSITFLYFSYGLLGGMGFSMVILSSAIIVQQHFQKHRALAAGISAAGISVGTLTGGPIIGTLAESFGWQGAFLILSGIAANCAVFGCFYRTPAAPIPKQNLLTDPNANVAARKGLISGVFVEIYEEMTNFALLRNLDFSLICVGTFFIYKGLTIFLQHTPSRAVSLGVERQSAAQLPIAIGIAFLVARIFGSFVGDMKFVNRTLQYSVCFILSGILIVVGTVATSFATIAAAGAIPGLLSGCALAVQTTILSDAVGVEKVARAAAFINVATGFGSLVGTPLAGFIYDRTRNYSIPFYTAGASEILGGVLVTAAAFLMKRQSKNKG